MPQKKGQPLRLILLGTLLFGAAGCGDGFKRDMSSIGSTVVNFASARTEAVNLMDALSDIDLLLDGNLVSRLQGDLALLDNVSGGLVIYAANAANPVLGGRRILTSPGQGSAINWNIPNGDYIFYLVGWPGVDMTGTVACGWANGGQPIRLDGGSHTITMDTFGCGAPPFAGALTGGPPTGNVAVEICDDIEDLNGITVASGCSGDDVTVDNFKFAIHEYDYFGAPSPPAAVAASYSLHSGTCFAEGATPVSQFIVPGNRDFRIRVPMEIKFYDPGSCADADYVKTVYFEGGLGAAYMGTPFPAATQQAGCAPENSRGRWVTSAGTAYLYLSESLCP